MNVQNVDSVTRTVRDFVLEEFLPGEGPEALEDATRLMTSGIVDSIGTIKLVSFLEERYGVYFEAHELSADHLDSVEAIVRTVESKLQAT